MSLLMKTVGDISKYNLCLNCEKSLIGYGRVNKFFHNGCKKEFLKNNLKRCECGKCDKLIPILTHELKPRRFAHGHYIKLNDGGYFGKGENNYNWKNGKRNHDGYMQIWKPEHPFATKEGYVSEHRLVWEQHNNAILLPWTHIHHINGIKDDNRIENLEPMTNSQHMRLHRLISRGTLI